MRSIIPLFGVAATALLIAAATAAAQGSRDANTQQAQQQETPRYDCRNVERCRAVVTCHPYSWEPWTCFRRRSCETVRVCTPVGGPRPGYEY